MENEGSIKEFLNYLEKGNFILSNEPIDLGNVSISNDAINSLKAVKWDIDNQCKSECVCDQKEQEYKKAITSDKVYLFTGSGESDLSMQIAEAKAKANTNLLGLRKTKVEIIDLTGKEIVNEINPYDYNSIVHGSYKMNYIDFCSDSNSNYNFISAGCGILELQETDDKDSRIGLVLMAYSYYDDDMDDLRNYITDGLMEIYASKYNEKYQIVNFHTAIEGFNTSKDYSIVIAGLID